MLQLHKPFIVRNRNPQVILTIVNRQISLAKTGDTDYSTKPVYLHISHSSAELLLCVWKDDVIDKTRWIDVVCLPVTGTDTFAYLVGESSSIDHSPTKYRGIQLFHTCIYRLWRVFETEGQILFVLFILSDCKAARHAVKQPSLNGRDGNNYEA